MKRVLDCIRILAEVRKSVPAHLLMAGDGPERGPAEHLARELNVDQHVIVSGQTESRGAADSAGACAADAERDGIVRPRALEAMACGVVPVATRVGGVPELITHGEDGFLEAVGDIDGAGRPRGGAADRRRSALPDGEGGPLECRRSDSARTASSRSTSTTTRTS